jgi:hypothetical protein
MEREKFYLFRAGAVLLGILSLVALVGLFYLLKDYKYLGNNQQKTITVVGNSKVYTKPDVSSIVFTVRYTSKTSAEAEDLVAKDVNTVQTKLEGLGIEEKDIKTTNYSAYPKYTYPQVTCVKYPCDAAKPVLEGYETTQTIEVKVRNLNSVGKVLDAISGSGVNEVSGPNFVIDDMEKVKSEARAAAIKDAREKAEVLADQLDVDLGDITYFADNQQVITPYMYARDSLKVESATAAGSVPSLPVGEQETNYSVSITYEIN